MKVIFAALLFLIAFCGWSQNGRIIEQTKYTYSDSAITITEKLVPDIRQAVRKVDFYHITYLSDGLKVKGYMAVPKKSAKYPCVIFNRGGNRDFSAITDDGFLRLLGKLAGSGYVIVASQYRGSAGGEGQEEFGGSDVNDVLNLIPLLDNIKSADTSRIGMFGWSRGGMMTYIALTKTDRIKAAVVGSGLADLNKTLESRPVFDSLWAGMIPGYATNKDALLKLRSATYFARSINKSTPILILQGTADWRVPADQVLDLVNKLYEVRQPFRFILYEGGEHSLIEHKTDYSMQIENWFNMYLRDGKKWPGLEPHGL